MDNDARVEALERYAAELEERIAELEDMLGLRMMTPFEWRFTASETRMFGALYTREICTKDMLLTSLGHVHAKDVPELKIVDVFICKMRKKLDPFKIDIETRWGAGYFLTPETKAKLKPLMEPQEEERRAG